MALCRLTGLVYRLRGAPLQRLQKFGRWPLQLLSHRFRPGLGLTARHYLQLRCWAYNGPWPLAVHWLQFCCVLHMQDNDVISYAKRVAS